LIATALEINKLFCEVGNRPEYDKEAITILQEKKNRIILFKMKLNYLTNKFVLLNGL
jgi:phosphoribosylaminoimidazolecarboxamide formyltransferase/IMP cyclohydrolase